MSLDPTLIDLLACPQCKGKLHSLSDAFACPQCKLRFAVEEGIPNFLLSDARPWEGEQGAGQPG